MIYTLPGMGTSSNMYSGPWREIANIKFLDWPKYLGEKSLSDIAERIIKENRITQSDEIAGSSLGGMVALEIASKLNMKNVYLFGSAISKSEINPFLLLFYTLSDIAPVKFIQEIVGKYQNDILEMFSSSDADFIRAMCHAIANWRGFTGDPNTINRVHGDNDQVISCDSSCERIMDGGHLIAMTHPIECIKILN